jgi:beta-galactosidase beta subunit
MILDRLTCWRRYASLHEGFASAFEALTEPHIADLPAGRHTVDGDRLYIIIGRDEGRGRKGARLESHRRYIDIQLTLAGPEEIGWLPLPDCLAHLKQRSSFVQPVERASSHAPSKASGADEPYNADRDIAFYSAQPETWLALPPGTFAVFYPDDAHAPLAGRGPLVKAVAKVAVEWR